MVRGQGDPAVAGEDEGAGMGPGALVDRKTIGSHYPQRPPGAHDPQTPETRKGSQRTKGDVAAGACVHRSVEAAIRLRPAEQQRSLVGLTHSEGGEAEPGGGAFGDEDLPVLGTDRHFEPDLRRERLGAVTGGDDQLAAGDPSAPGVHLQPAPGQEADVLDTCPVRNPHRERPETRAGRASA